LFFVKHVRIVIIIYLKIQSQRQCDLTRNSQVSPRCCKFSFKFGT